MGGEVSNSLNTSRGTSDTNFAQSVWGGQGSALEDMYQQFAQNYDSMSGGFDQQNAFGQQFGQDVMGDQRAGAQDAQAGGVYQDMNLQGNLMRSLNQSERNPSAMQDINSMIMGGSGNNYADAMKQNYMRDANQSQEMMLGNMDARAAASGMSGGARHGRAIGQGMDGINRNLQSNLAQTGFQTFDKDLDRKLAIAQQADQGTLARQGMMQNMLGNQQQTQNTGMGYGGDLFNQANTTQNTPWNQMSSYSSMLGNPTVLGSGSGNTSNRSFGTSSSGGGSWSGK